MADVVLSDAQMGMFQVIRPMPNFESIYQGVAGTVPIAFPGVLAPEAGRPGFDPNLLAGIPVPLGSRLLVQIPMTIDTYTPIADYAYQFIWRTRNQTAVAEAILSGRQASPYHLPSEVPGRKESSLSPDDLFFIPDHGRQLLQTDHHDVIHVRCADEARVLELVKHMEQEGYALPTEPPDATFIWQAWMPQPSE